LENAESAAASNGQMLKGSVLSRQGDYSADRVIAPVDSLPFAVIMRMLLLAKNA